MYREALKEFDITFFYTGPATLTCRKELDGMELQDVAIRRYRSDADLLFFGPLQRLSAFKLGLGSWMLSRVAEALNHDVINVVDPIYKFVSQLASRARYDQKLVVVRWEVIPNRYDDVLGGHSRSHRVYARADGVVCTSWAARASLALRSPDASRVTVIYPGVVLPQRTMPPPSPEPHIVTVARLQWQKGLDDLIAAIALLRRDGVPARLTVIGSGNPRPWSRLANSYGLGEEIAFAGSLSNTEVRQHIADAAVYCQPSAVSRTWCEQFGFSVVEAMGGGRPVVTCSSGVLPEIVGPDGVYAPARNAAALAEALASVLTDPAAASERGLRLALYARERYDATRQGAALREFLCAL